MTLETVPQPERHSGSDTATEVPNEVDHDLDLDDNSAVAQQTSRIRIVSHGTDDWNPAFVALNVPSHQVSKSASSVVRDAGYSFESSESALERPPEQEQALKGLGTQFDPQTSGLDHSIWGDAAYQKTHFLETWLRSKIVPSAERRDLPFLPIDQLELIMTYKNISRELQQAGLHEDIKATTTLLCQRRKKSRQRIFAILCMLQLPAQIVDFIRAGIFDEDLPFTFKNSLVYRERTSETKKVETPLSLFEAPCWKPHVRESFERYQAQVSAPIFKLSWTKGEKVLHFLLKDQLVLPFMPVKDTSGDGELEIFLRHYGGTSTVRKVKIHPAHFNPCPKMPANTDVYLAVKELTAVKTSNKPDEEARALKRVNAKQDPHLIRLLATYTYEGRFHLIFPWADGNLKDLWMMPNVQFIEQNRNLGPVKWMATQILGLACALQKIHYCPIDDDNVEDLPAHDKERLYGRHGDLKPENILWFRNEEESHEDDTIGILKIADFGFADFHSKHSRSNVRRSAVGGFTDTYKAPEYDVNQRVSPQYDIWSFGCILLQFVVWYLRGWQGVDDFSKERTADSKGAMMAADIFFGLEASNMNAFRARAKLSVVEMFKSLKNDGACSDYILDLLEYVQTDLLRVDRSKRAKIYDIVKKFKQLHDYCQNSSEYCLSRTKLASRTDSELSEIVEVPISPGKAFVADSPSPVRSGTWPSPHARRSISIGSQYDLQTHPRRKGSSPSIANRDRDLVRPQSKLAQNSPTEPEIAQSISRPSVLLSIVDYAHTTSSNIGSINTTTTNNDQRFPTTNGAIADAGQLTHEITRPPGAKGHDSTRSIDQNGLYEAQEMPKPDINQISVAPNFVSSGEINNSAIYTTSPSASPAAQQSILAAQSQPDLPITRTPQKQQSTTEMQQHSTGGTQQRSTSEPQQHSTSKNAFVSRRSRIKRYLRRLILKVVERFLGPSET